MTLFINIPKEFVEHFEKDKFVDSLERIRTDLHYNLTTDNIGLAGNYELELIEMLIKAFKDCKRGNTTTISDYPYSALKLEEAKELLAKWVELYKPKLEGFPKPPIQVDTEQFLKEVEK